MEKFVTPCELPTPYEREVLTILIEECSEIQKRATKMLRFGVDEIQPGVKLDNKARLSQEIGDFLCVYYMAIDAGLTNQALVLPAQQEKRKKLERYMQTTKPGSKFKG